MSNRFEMTSAALSVRNDANFSFENINDQRILEIREHWLKLRAEIKLAGNIEEYKSLFQSPINRLQRQLSTLPFSFDSVEFDVDQSINRLLRSSKNLNLESPIRYFVVEVCKLLIELLRAGENPLLPALTRALDSETLVVIKDSNWTTEVQNYLKLTSDYEPRVVSINRLAYESIAKKIVYLGSPTFMSYRYFSEPDTRFLLDPKALENHFIMYPLGNLKTISGLIESSSVRRVFNYNSPVVFEIEDFEQAPSDWSAISSRKHAVESGSEICEPARFVGLAGGNHIWMSSKPDAKCRVLTLSRNGELEVEGRLTSELREGEMIVERIGRSSPSLIDSIANALGAEKYRSSQHKWKEALQEKILRVGNLKEVERTLRIDFGVDVSNLRHWAYDPRSIAPSSQNDFKKTCSYLGLEKSAATLWSDLSEIRSLHLKAGNEISSRLQEAMLKLSVDEIRDSEGLVLINVQDYGSLGIFRVEYCSGEELKVPILDIDVVTSNDENQ